MPRGKDYIGSAFMAICKEAQSPGSYFVCLMEHRQRYGGPEEGGWWATDTECIQYQEFPTETLANTAKEKIETLASELTEQSKRSESEACARSMEWLEARGLEADFLPEPDGPTRYSVRVCEQVPMPKYGPTHYE